MDVLNFTGSTLTPAAVENCQKALAWLLADPAIVSVNLPVECIGKTVNAVLDRNGQLRRS